MNIVVLVTLSFLFFSTGEGETPVQKKCSEVEDLANGMDRIHQTWHCHGDGKVTCTETTESCDCDGKFNIFEFEETYDIKPQPGTCVNWSLIKKCGPGVVLRGETKEKVLKKCNK